MIDVERRPQRQANQFRGQVRHGLPRPLAEQRQPDSREYPDVSQTAVLFDPPARLAYTSPAPDGSGAGMTVTVDFTEVEGGTLVRLVHSGIPDMKVEGNKELRAIVRSGWTASFGKLGNFLGAASRS